MTEVVVLATRFDQRQRQAFCSGGRLLLGFLAGMFISSAAVAAEALATEGALTPERQEGPLGEVGSGSVSVRLNVKELLAGGQTELNAIRQAVLNAERIRDERESLLRMIEPLDLERQLQESARWNRPAGQRQIWALWGALMVFGGVLIGSYWARR